MKIKTKIKQLQRRFENITADKFMYTTKRDLRRKAKWVTCHYLIYDPDIGHTIMPFQYRRGEPQSHKYWVDFVKNESYRIFTSVVLDTINTRHGRSYKLKKLIGWNKDLKRKEYNRKKS